MTNRELIDTLSDEELVVWLLGESKFEFESSGVPTLDDFRGRSDARECLLKWLKERRHI